MMEREPDEGARSREAALDNAWRIHDAQADWTGKVDNKAAFALTVHTSLLALAVALFDNLGAPLEFAVFAIACCLLVGGAACSASVVAPRLGSGRLERESAKNFVYFGHARYWEPEQLANGLAVDDLLPQLSRQIVVMAQIAWVKHVRVGWAIWLGLGGGAFLLVAALISGV